MRKGISIIILIVLYLAMANTNVSAQVMKFTSNKVSVLEPGTNRLLTFNGNKFKTNSSNTIEFAETLIVVGLNDKKLGSQMLTLHPNGKFFETKDGLEIETKENYFIKIDSIKKEINFYFEAKLLTMTFFDIVLLDKN